MRIAFYTLGCKTNQFETQAMERIARSFGAEIVHFSEQADIYVVNSCTVTSEADRKSRAAIQRAKKRSPQAVVGICGCYSQLCADEIRNTLPVDAVSGNRDHEAFLRELITLTPKYCVLPAGEDGPPVPLPAGALEGRTRALLKIEDGCDRRCAYCIIPSARGEVRSLPPAAAISEAKRLRNEGYCEIVLTGIEISSYGRDLGGPDLCTLVHSVCEAAPDVRIRLGSLEPCTVTERFCETLHTCRNLCGHFHLSLQSGSDSVLRRMRRGYTAERYLKSVELLRRYFPMCNITTDIICGFPGESETEHRDTLLLVETAGFGRVHVFPFSPRAGTEAAAMPERIPKNVRDRRCRETAKAGAHAAERFMRNLAGTVHPVLFETRGGGYTPNYVYVASDVTCPPGSVRSLVLTEVSGEGMKGRPAE